MRTTPESARRTGVVLLHAGFAAGTGAGLLYTLYDSLWQLLTVLGCVAVLVMLSIFLAHVGAGRWVRWSWLGWIATALVATQVSLGWREGLRTGYRFDWDAGWYLQANLRDKEMSNGKGIHYSVSSDTLGHRNTLPYPDDGRLPAVMQGDSNTFGVGLEAGDTLAAVYTAATGTPGYNFGSSGYDLHNYWFQYARKIAPRFTVDRRMVFLNYGNDFTMSALATPYRMPRPYLASDAAGALQPVDPPPPFRKQVYGHHFIRTYAQYDPLLAALEPGRDWGYRLPGWLAPIRLATFAVEVAAPVWGQLRYRTFDAEALRAANRVDPYYPVWQVAARETWPEPYRSFADDFVTLLRAIGAQHPNTIVVALPMRDQVLPDDATLRRRLADEGFPPDSLDRLAFNRLAAEAAGDGSFTLIDTTAAFQRDVDAATLFRPNDEHLSPRGTRLVIDTLLSRLD